MSIPICVDSSIDLYGRVFFVSLELRLRSRLYLSRYLSSIQSLSFSTSHAKRKKKIHINIYPLTSYNDAYSRQAKNDLLQRF